MNTTTEIWRPVPGFTNYSVSNLGNVLSHQRLVTPPHGKAYIRQARVLHPAPNRKGYPTVHLTDGGTSRTFYVHDLVAAAFLGAKPEGQQVRHLSDEKSDCSVSNLAYGTASDNQLDSVRNGRHGMASRTHCKHGHQFAGSNLTFFPYQPTVRVCLACREIRAQQRRDRQRSAAPTQEFA